MEIKLGRLSHVGIGVRNIEATLQQYSAIFGIQLEKERINVPGFDLAEGEIVRARSANMKGLKVAFITMGNTAFEFFELPESSLTGGKRYGIYHVGFIVDDLKSKLAELKAKGIEPAEGFPKSDKLVYLRPSEGVLIELTDKTWRYTKEPAKTKQK